MRTLTDIDILTRISEIDKERQLFIDELLRRKSVLSQVLSAVELAMEDLQFVKENQ